MTFFFNVTLGPLRMTSSSGGVVQESKCPQGAGAAERAAREIVVGPPLWLVEPDLGGTPPVLPLVALPSVALPSVALPSPGTPFSGIPTNTKCVASLP